MEILNFGFPLCYNLSDMIMLVYLSLILTLIFGQTAEEIALNTENWLSSHQSLQADFEQIYYSSSVSTPLKQKGKLFMQKPVNCLFIFILLILNSRVPQR